MATVWRLYRTDADKAAEAFCGIFKVDTAIDAREQWARDLGYERWADMPSLRKGEGAMVAMSDDGRTVRL